MKYIKNHILEQSDAETTKLAPNLLNKTKYVCHYRNLKLYLQQGCKLTKVHRVLKFKQAPILKEYILFNMNKRKEAKDSKNEFLVALFKLMNNAIFGRTMLNKDKQRNIKLVSDDKKFLNYVSKPHFQDCKLFQHDLCAVEMEKLKVKYDSPIVMGMAILELSKVLMYNFHYNVIKKKYGDEAKLLFTDTDSLCYHIQTKDVYQDMIELDDNSDKEKDQSHFPKYFDRSEYPKGFKTLSGNTVWSDKNEKKNGFFKDETKGAIIKEFVGLRSKMYSCLKEDNHFVQAKKIEDLKEEIEFQKHPELLKMMQQEIEKEEQTLKEMIENESVKDKNKAVAKGIPSSVQKGIKHEDYKKAVEGDEVN
jgi:hypothetical protein